MTQSAQHSLHTLHNLLTFVPSGSGGKKPKTTKTITKEDLLAKLNATAGSKTGDESDDSNSEAED